MHPIPPATDLWTLPLSVLLRLTHVGGFPSPQAFGSYPGNEARGELITRPCVCLLAQGSCDQWKRGTYMYTRMYSVLHMQWNLFFRTLSHVKVDTSCSFQVPNLFH